MKMYLDRLNNKPKLRKILKVISIILIVLNVLWYFILNICLLVGALSDKEEINVIHTQVLPQVKLEGTYNNQKAFYGSSYFTGESALYTWTDYFNEHNINNQQGLWQVADTLTINQKLEYNYYVNSSLKIGIYDTNSNYLQNPVDLNIIHFEKWQRTSNYQRFSIKFMSDVSTDYVAIYWNVFYDLDLANFGEGTGGITGAVVNNFLESDIGVNEYAFGVIIDNLERDTFINDVFYNSNKTYADGYDAGREVGYENGYNRGYIDGTNAPSDTRYSPFSVIESAFGAVASVLNIDLLPGISLGLLIFVPVVVAVLIVVVKMIKG